MGDGSVKKQSDGFERHVVTGDFIKLPPFFSLTRISNAIRRYVGSPERRARAWEEYALFLQRRGWRASDRAYARAYGILRNAGSLTDHPRSDAVLFETELWRVVAPGRPFIDRNDGGHLIIFPVSSVEDRMHFEGMRTRELGAISKAVGRAFQEVMNESNVPVERLNFMDMGNWSILEPGGAHFHLHIFGRARGSRFQIHGEFNQLPPKGSRHYDMLKPLSEGEIESLRKRIPEYFASELAALRR